MWLKRKCRLKAHISLCPLYRLLSRNTKYQQNGNDEPGRNTCEFGNHVVSSVPMTFVLRGLITEKWSMVGFNQLSQSLPIWNFYIFPLHRAGGDQPEKVGDEQSSVVVHSGVALSQPLHEESETWTRRRNSSDRCKACPGQDHQLCCSRSHNVQLGWSPAKFYGIQISFSNLKMYLSSFLCF